MVATLHRMDHMAQIALLSIIKLLLATLVALTIIAFAVLKAKKLRKYSLNRKGRNTIPAFLCIKTVT